MKTRFGELDQAVAQARVALSIVATLVLYVDPSASGLFHLSGWLLVTLVCHFVYSATIYLLMRYRVETDLVPKVSSALDLIFATAIAFLTEGGTSPSFVFFVFAIVAVGFRTGFRNTLLVTSGSVALYITVVGISEGLPSVYMMRAVYLAIAGYLIGFFGQQRVNFETRLRELKTEAEKNVIARSLHDGYIQALAGLNLRLESCRDMLANNQSSEALAEVKEIQIAVTREYDEVREYVRSLTSIDRKLSHPVLGATDTQFRIEAGFTSGGLLTENILQIVLEAVRNARRHGNAEAASIRVEQAGATIRITVDDDGVGFGNSTAPPWTIASRVAEFDGRLAINTDGPGAHLEIAIPAE